MSFARSAYGVSTIYCEYVTDDQACGRAAKPKNSIRNFFSAPETTNGHFFQHCVQGVSLTSGHHLVRHRRLDHTRADGINANALCGVFPSSALTSPITPCLAA